jgi:hypothetical protein
MIILAVCILLFVLYVVVLTLVFYHAGNLFSLNFKKPKPEAYTLTEEDKRALEDYRNRRDNSQ